MERKIEKVLSEFNISVRVIGKQVTPQVTRYFVSPVNGSKRIKVSKVGSFTDDLGVALGRSPIRVLADPQNQAIAIEVPNQYRQFVALDDVLKVKDLRRTNGLKVVLGVDQDGRSVIFDLSDAPHVLIAGATGSGKSVCISSMIQCLSKVYRPSEVQMILVDPKMVELKRFNGTPHLWIDTITDARHASLVLSMMLGLMDRRYRGFQQGGVRNLAEYNKRYTDRQPRFVIVIDELADLMTLGKEIEPKIVRLAQLGRAAGIHLVVATQRPSVDVVTGLIKANFPARIAFKVSTGIDSRVILDEHGAEALLGKGDGLLKDGQGRLVRFQGCI